MLDPAKAVISSFKISATHVTDEKLLYILSFGGGGQGQGW